LTPSTLLIYKKMPNFITHFHFLRPWLLTLLIPAAGLVWYALRTQDSRRGMQALIADHLLEHLLVGRGQQKKVSPVYLLAAFWIVAIIALAGPAWKKEPSPFTRDTAGLVIVYPGYGRSCHCPEGYPDHAGSGHPALPSRTRHPENP